MKIRIQNSQIKYETGKAMLISIPRTNNTVWVPVSLVYRNDNGWSSTVYLPDGMEFHAQHGKIEKYTLDVDGMLDAFESVDIRDKQLKKPEIIHHKPEHKDPIKKRVIDDDLTR